MLLNISIYTRFAWVPVQRQGELAGLSGLMRSVTRLVDGAGVIKTLNTGVHKKWMVLTRRGSSMRGLETQI